MIEAINKRVNPRKLYECKNQQLLSPIISTIILSTGLNSESERKIKRLGAKMKLESKNVLEKNNDRAKTLQKNTFTITSLQNNRT